MRKEKLRKIFLIAVLAGMVSLSNGMSVYAEEIEETSIDTEEVEVDVLEVGIVAQGSENGYNWKIDQNGKLTIKDDGNGNSFLWAYQFGNPDCPKENDTWATYGEQIVSLEVDVHCIKRHPNADQDSSFSGANFDCFNGLNHVETATIKIDYFDYDYAFLRYLNRMKELKLIGFSGNTDMTHFFGDVTVLEKIDISQMDTSQVTNMSRLFKGCKNLTELNMGNMDTSKVTDMSEMFAECSKFVTLDLSCFDTSQVVNMSEMFSDCEGIESLNISGFDTSKVTNMAGMFRSFGDKWNYNYLDLSNFNTSNVTDMTDMFSGCEAQNIVISGFDTSKVVSMREMFYKARVSELDLSTFDVSNVEDFGSMFGFCGLSKLNMQGWHLKDEANKGGMFIGDTVTDQYIFDGWNFEDFTNLNYFFTGDTYVATTIDGLDFSSWNLTNLKDTVRMFNNTLIRNTDMNTLDVSHVQNMVEMFRSLRNTDTLDLSGWDVSNVEDMDYMFEGAAISGIDLNSWDVSSLKDCQNMFNGCKKLTSIILKDWNTSALECTHNMFWDCRLLTNVDLSNWDTSSLNRVSGMFGYCSSLKQIDFGNNEFKNLVSVNHFIYLCTSLEFLDLRNWDFTGIQKKDYAQFWRDYDLEDSETSKLKEIGLPKNLGYNVFLPENTWYRMDTGEQVTKAPTTGNETIILKTTQSIFTDIEMNEWKYSFAKYVYDKKIMTGKGTNTFGDILFAPDDNLTRAELAQMLYSMEGKPAVTYTNTFTDVKSDKWYAKAVLWANEKGIATGVSAGKFDPNGQITREQMATMLKKYAQMKGYDVNASIQLNSFPDASSVSSWAKSNISWAVAKGVISGKAKADGSKILDPQGKATRAECAAMLKSFCEKVAEE